MKEGNGQEELPSSPYRVLQQISEEAVRVAGEALQNVYSSSSSKFASSGVVGHRRSRSEIVTSSVHRSGSNFNKWKSQMQRALKNWGSTSQEDSSFLSFNPEVLANQKRQWYQLHSKTSDYKKYKEPDALFEHFVIVGLHPDANLEDVEDAFARRKKWEVQLETSDMVDFRMLSNCGPSVPSLEPQVLFKYPPGKKLAMRLKDLAAFCFPGGVKAHVMERTPSFSELNELVYGQEHLGRDDSSFIFSLKVADNATLYGVCLHVPEIVQRPPAIYVSSSPLSQSSIGRSRFLVSAPRCYCLLTRVPLFELHYEMLNSVIAQERLNRITHFVSEINLTDFIPAASKMNDASNASVDSSYRDDEADWTASAIPVDSAIALTAAAAGIIDDDEVPSSSSKWEVSSPVSLTASEASDHSQTRGFGKDGGRNIHYVDDCVSEASEVRSDSTERVYGIQDNYRTPESGPSVFSKVRSLERLGSFESLFSSARSMASEEEDDDLFFSNEKDAGCEMIMEWARENKNDLLQIVCSYHSLPLPPRGSKIIFQPLEHLQAIEYERISVSELGISEKHMGTRMNDPDDAAKVNFHLAAAEEAVGLSIWTTATICRSLSIETVLALITGVLLEKQVVIMCPNLGVLSAVVLSLIPIIRPFQWQSLFLPILPGKMLDFLDAPVPFIVGLQHKPTDLKMKSANLVRVNVTKDQIKSCYLPLLPQRKELLSELRPIHAKLSREDSVAQRRPIYRCSEVQTEAAAQFLTVMRRYLESLCSDLRSHTITSVQSNSDRVSILLKDSFIDSFPGRDQPFVKLFVDTQLFTVLSDARLSSYENE
ncbi:uncharacterized protein LOC132053034 isoform X1 [Lycium ferocissimum]|uniref:uncharacterized protein LOC132053034 isoform X1 n=2 Tax=Lycium ferocissimum TaxID=112874 RepID=UPI002815EF68|nr:uncharacterized protein LOC132053034 isoform X1 [Lycium ferocissimum]XP_059300814.1 uncharacterized protein LOC132053034 isoform X1 [Lycium ferocissimum]